MELRKALCRGAKYGTDESAGPHGPHQFFPHAWAEAIDCPGWTAREHDAASLAELMLRTDPGLPELALQCHPVVEYALMQVIIPGYQEFIDELSSPMSMPLQKFGGIPVMRTVAAERGAWTLASGMRTIAEGVLDQS
jgi:hypothetical protein